MSAKRPPVKKTVKEIVKQSSHVISMTNNFIEWKNSQAK